MFSTPTMAQAPAPKAPKPDPEAAAEAERIKQEEAEAKRLADIAEEKRKRLEEEERLARAKGLRGRRSLLSAGSTGFSDENKPKQTLGG